ncbi:hypothetical protein [Bacillus aquiflavi]|uniref:hypothetical protein n=1 Tax=Bacillus aquiflavi TaxID=2672567 RepID=UPI001FEBE0F2|nr:hypothetical protein [Bacillus aquiflavi]
MFFSFLSIFFSTHITSDLEKVADFITFINDGEILLSKTKDELLEEYCIVKGNKEALTTSHHNSFIGIKENNYGFEALSKNKKEVMKQMGDSVIIEKPTLEDIMVFSIKRSDNRVSSY